VGKAWDWYSFGCFSPSSFRVRSDLLFDDQRLDPLEGKTFLMPFQPILRVTLGNRRGLPPPQEQAGTTGSGRGHKTCRGRKILSRHGLRLAKRPARGR
jgi:hypothetical protein